MIVRHSRHASLASLRRRRGFTLVELMVVIAIIGLLATVVTVNVMDKMADARKTKAASDIVAINDAIKLFKIDSKNKGRWPQSLNDLFPAGREPYISGKQSADELKDPWGTNYGYTPPSSGGNYDVYSYGADGGSGGQGENADIHLKDALSGDTSK
jgi:general secretion pathway protein G